jgi:hypothetical protein
LAGPYILTIPEHPEIILFFFWASIYCRSINEGGYLVDLVTWPQRTTNTRGWTAPYKFQTANTKATVKPVIRWNRDGHAVWVLWAEPQKSNEW